MNLEAAQKPKEEAAEWDYSMKGLEYHAEKFGPSPAGNRKPLKVTF